MPVANKYKMTQYLQHSITCCRQVAVMFSASRIGFVERKALGKETLRAVYVFRPQTLHNSYFSEQRIENIEFQFLKHLKRRVMSQVCSKSTCHFSRARTTRVHKALTISLRNRITPSDIVASKSVRKRRRRRLHKKCANFSTRRPRSIYLSLFETMNEFLVAWAKTDQTKDAGRAGWGNVQFMGKFRCMNGNGSRSLWKTLIINNVF